MIHGCAHPGVPAHRVCTEHHHFACDATLYGPARRDPTMQTTPADRSACSTVFPETQKTQKTTENPEINLTNY